MALTPTETSLFFTRQDPEDPRLGDFTSGSAATNGGAVVQVFGWPDDEGIRLNGGRPGAAEAPDRIRRPLYKMTPSLTTERSVHLWDRGNLNPADQDLGARHEEARRLTAEAYRRGDRVLSLGGGHDYGFPDAAGFLDAFATETVRPVVVNFDAHLDVRPVKDSFHSGTPFRRLLTAFPDRFDFIEIGLQPQCNSRAHAAWAKAQGAHLWMADDVRDEADFHSHLLTWVNRRLGQPLFISLDIDVIQSSEAPGCSQSWALGLTPVAVQQTIHLLMDHLPTKGLGIYEVSPALDQDDRTSKLAALFAHQFIFHDSRGGHR
ncbi:MAG: formimidoylglutamase [Bdellovibrionaceae bacterium]|nr:formimidoylglutamase [Pseudobdellovibrionaceae bacterium]